MQMFVVKKNSVRAILRFIGRSEDFLSNSLAFRQVNITFSLILGLSLNTTLVPAGLK